MNKLLTIASGLLLVSALSAQEFKITGGWQLLGATDDVNLSIFNDTCVEYIWKYDTNDSSNPEWQIHIVNEEYNSTAPTIQALNKGNGFWIKSSYNFGSYKLSDVNEYLSLIGSGLTLVESPFGLTITTSSNIRIVFANEKGINKPYISLYRDDGTKIGDYSDIISLAETEGIDLKGCLVWSKLNALLHSVE